MISIKKMHEWVFQERKKLSFLVVNYSEQGHKLTILEETEPIPIEHISWDCFTIEAQGYRVIQMSSTRKIVEIQTKRGFYKGFLAAYDKYRQKEQIACTPSIIPTNGHGDIKPRSDMTQLRGFSTFRVWHQLS